MRKYFNLLLRDAALALLARIKEPNPSEAHVVELAASCLRVYK